MSAITIKNIFNKKIYTSTDNENILMSIQSNNIDWMHACGAKGRCTTCKFIIVNGHNNISTETDIEVKYRELNKLSENERLACQCTAVDDITILVPESGKMPHMKYSD
ncbi:MAG: (2Fe-2S)-binding protein [Cyclobacteriaceae bacterium]|nr:(2Fe-2S)-binding protein [Cyclobacteriaceae bacterium]